HFADRSAWEAFAPGRGAYLTARVITEQCLLWSVGIPAQFSLEQFLVCSAALVVAGVYYFRRAAFPVMAVSGLVLALSSYLLVYSFRHYLGLEALRGARWYLAFPHLGIVLFLSAGLCRTARFGNSAAALGLDCALPAINPKRQRGGAMGSPSLALRA